MTRLQSLRKRRGILISANKKNNYTQSGNPKIEKYYKTMLSIRKQINAIECVNIRPLKARVGMTVKDLYNLNKIY
jgi:hypothetical protein